MTSRIKIKGEHRIIYNLKLWQKNDDFYILNDTSGDVTLVELMDSLGILNHSISIVGYWIFDYNYKKALCLTQ